MKLLKYVIYHSSKYGESVYFFLSEASLSFLEHNVEKVCQQLDIDFEPEKDESISITRVDENNLPVVKYVQ